MQKSLKEAHEVRAQPMPSNSHDDRPRFNLTACSQDTTHADIQTYMDLFATLSKMMMMMMLAFAIFLCLPMRQE